MMGRREVHRYSLDSGTGTQTITDNLNRNLDLSGCQAISVRMVITAADTDAADELEVALQASFDGTEWDDRIRFEPVLGDTSPSASAPEVRVATIQQKVDMASTEEMYEETDSAGADLTPGSVRNGTFPPPARDENGRIVSWRLKIDVTDADSNAGYEGTIYVYAFR